MYDLFAKKGVRLSKKEVSFLILIGGGLFATLGGIYFFDTRDAVLKCDKETNVCVYLRSAAPICGRYRNYSATNPYRRRNATRDLIKQS